MAGSIFHTQTYNIMLYLFNTTIMPNEGVYINRKVIREEAAKIIHRHSAWMTNPQTETETYHVRYTSAIGHAATADVFNQLFPHFSENPVQVNRIAATMQPGDEAICLKVLGRLEEGKILGLDELEAIGYELYHVTNIGASFNPDGSVVSSTIGYLATDFNSQPWVHGTPSK